MAKNETQPARWDPFREIAALESWSPFRDAPLSQLMRPFLERAGSASFAAPAVDVTENEKAYVVTAELPGVKREEITIECQNGTLSIRGEKKLEREEKSEKGRLLERRYGAFSRSFTLPEDADTEQTKASFRDGVLRLEIAKRPEAKPRTIAIKD